MSTNFGLAGIPGTRLKVCVWVGEWWGGSHTQYSVTPAQARQVQGAGAVRRTAGQGQGFQALGRGAEEHGLVRRPQGHDQGPSWPPRGILGVGSGE